MRLSVAICTWNRAKLLDQTLARMHDLSVSNGVDWELLVVNNNCTDDTDAVIARHADALPLRRLHEPKQGHSNARNCAMREASGSWILWTDDDVLVEPDWLVSLASAIDRHPEASIIGGRVDPWFPIEPDPELVAVFPTLGSGFCGVNHGEQECEVTDPMAFCGANLAMRMKEAARFLFNPHYGRNKSKQGLFDETDFIVRMQNQGSRLLWCPGMRVRHYVDPSRMTVRHLCAHYEGIGYTEAIKGANEIRNSASIFGVPRWVARKLGEHWLRYTACRLIGRRRQALCHLRDFHRCWGLVKGHRELLSESKSKPEAPLKPAGAKE